MTSFHAHQLKRAHYSRQFVLDHEPQSPNPYNTPCIPVGTRVLVHRRISPVAVAGVVVGGDDNHLTVQLYAGATWCVNADSVTVQP